DSERNAAATRPFFHVLEQSPVTRFAPGFDGTFVERLAGIGDDQIEVEIDGVAKALATRARAIGIVERKKTRLRFLIKHAVVFTFEALVESEALGAISAGIGDEFEDGFAAAFPVADFYGVCKSRTRFGIHGE